MSYGLMDIETFSYRCLIACNFTTDAGNKMLAKIVVVQFWFFKLKLAS